MRAQLQRLGAADATWVLCANRADVDQLDEGQRALGSRAALVSSSLLFALYHGDPLHVVSVLPLSFLLGTLRLRTGSIVPCIAAHFGNNLLSLILLMVWGVDADVAVPWAVAALCLTVSLVALLRSCGVNVRLERAGE